MNDAASRMPRLFWPGDPDADHGAPTLWDFVERDHPWPGQALQFQGESTAACRFVDVILDVAYHDTRRPTLAVRLDPNRGPTDLPAARAALAAWCEQRGHVPVPSTLDLLP